MSANINRLVGKKIADRYCITGEIGVGGMGRVFRAMPFDDPSLDVAIKVILRNRVLNSEDLLRFQKEAALMSRLHHPNIICFHELGLLNASGKDGSQDIGSGYYIVMEVANGSNLKDSLALDGRKDLAFFFQVGLQVTAALDYTHGKNIIHRDIKPQNIVVGKPMQDQRDLVVKVLDFGVARLAEAMHFSSSNGEGSSKKGYHDVAGTPLYMAPEQTPLMDAPIDHRVDLYSLGCVLYEILVGRPPFSASTREKLERQHVFTSPEPLTSLRPDVPPIIEQIVHKLLSKHPDDRYQSAFALHTDLLRAKRRLSRRDRPSAITFPLGLNDRFQSVSSNLPLVGRENEMKKLVDGYSAVAQEKGRSLLSVVQGVAGTGKTRLLRDLRNYLGQRKIRFISANFSQHENALPFNALANGFNDYLIRVLKSQPHEAEELRRKVRTLLGPTAHQVAAVVPGLRPFISEEVGKVDENIGAGDFQTFSKAFSDFTRCLAVDNQPVVFIFDDLHWADDKSLELIDQFFSHNNSQRFFMIISHRSNDPMTSPRFKAFLDKFRKLRRRYEEMELKPFDLLAVKKMTENMLASPNGISDDLVNYLFEQARGNPMHLVEFVRTLVARDIIYLTSARQEKWNYDIEAISRATFSLATVDLALSRIQDFQGYDRSVLEIAACVGLSFQYELLLLDGSKDGVKVLKAIKRGMDEGLIARVQDEAELKLLGKTYSFTHWRARDAIYRNIEPERRSQHHKAIAEKLDEFVKNPTAKSTFSLAHHFNNSLNGVKAGTDDLAKKIIRANVSAGRAAKNAGSWQSAQRYYENAYNQVQQWNGTVATSDETADIVDNLADLAALQRRHGEALKRYNELSKLQLSPEMWSALAYKMAHLQMVSGMITNAVNSVRNFLQRMRLPVPKPTLTNYIKFWVSLIYDIMPQPKRRHRLYQALKAIFKNENNTSLNVRGPNFGARLYNLGQLLSMQERPPLSLIYHHMSLQESLKGRAPSTTVIRAIGDRGAILAYFGFYRAGYHFLDLAMDVSKSIKAKSTYGYLSLIRSIVMDYLKDKDDEVGDQLRIALKYLSPEEERMWYGIAVEFKMYRELIKGNLSAVNRYSQAIPETIPTRNWLSPRAMSITFYAFLLQDARDSIVRFGELFLKRREEVSGRQDDIFIHIINTIVTFAKGEIDKTRNYFTIAMQDFIRGNNYVFLFPFEEDFVALFAYTFPLIFEQEHGRRLMRDAEMKALLLRLSERVHKIKGGKRGMTNMLYARSREVLGKYGKVKERYDSSMHFAKVGNNQLILTLTYLWFGDLLIKSGQKKRSDYLKKAHALASTAEMAGLVKYIEKLMERRGIVFQRAKRKENGKEFALKFGAYRSRLVFEHIEHISEVLQLDIALEQNLEESLAIVQRQYKCSRIICILSKGDDSKPQVVYPYDLEQSAQNILSYVEPYFNIRSTLFLPTSDAPWNENISTPDRPMGLTQSPIDIETAPDAWRDDVNRTEVVDATVVLEEHTLLRTNAKTQFEETGFTKNQANSTVANSILSSESRQRSLHMSALIPLRSDSGNVGVLFMEDLALADKETTLCRNELDVFGAQLGLLIERKTSPQRDMNLLVEPQIEIRTLNYRNANYSLELAPWLRLWTHGQLRSRREAAWYLGLNFGSDHYLMAYCRLNGPQEIREKLSAMVWNHILVHRSIAISTGKTTFDPNEIRDELGALLSCFAASQELEAISISFTLFSREKKSAISGHFGPSRPLVLCKENNITPQNDVIMTLNNGRDVRYWTVHSSMGGPHAYILPHDSSKLDVNLSVNQRKSLHATLLDTTRKQELHLIIERLVMRENLPRYYVGAVLVEDEQAALNSLELLDKAE